MEELKAVFFSCCFMGAICLLIEQMGEDNLMAYLFLTAAVGFVLTWIFGGSGTLTGGYGPPY